MKNNNLYISFVVDKLAQHYYQAELLLYSLEKFSGIDRDHIIVQCLNRVDQFFLDFLKEQDYKYNIIEPYLDGKYSNKLQQLEYFDSMKLDAVLLLDTDMFVISSLADFSFQIVAAKTVDAPNPNIEVLEGIYKEAGINFPAKVRSDWNIENNITFENNFNGGFYYIPSKYIDGLSKNWKKWGKWLFDRKYLFQTLQQQNHIDQISFSLALAEQNIKYKCLSTNYNYPIQTKHPVTLYDKNDNIKIIHYHKALNEFGLLDTGLFNESDEIYKKIMLANNTIIQKEKITFFALYRKSLITLCNNPSIALEFSEVLQKCHNIKKSKLIIHVGTPKTGTSSIQKSLYDNYEENLKKGLYYPKIDLHANPPKHQWLIDCLRNRNIQQLLNYFQMIEDELALLSEVKTIVLSTEGIYNHWWDLSTDSKILLRVISEVFNVEFIVTFREPKSFIESYYKQIIKNPKNKYIECYGTTLSCEELLLKDKWFVSHLDYVGFLFDLQKLCPKAFLSVQNYEKDIISLFYSYVNIPLVSSAKVFENSGLSMYSIEILKNINTLDLNVRDKKEVVLMLSKCDKILKKYITTNSIDLSIVEQIFHLQKNILVEEFGLRFF